MKLIVGSDRRSPSVVHMVVVGEAMDEVDGTRRGPPLEHMMFKELKKFAREFNKQVAAAGGRDNAFTQPRHTAYFQQVPKEASGPDDGPGG